MNESKFIVQVVGTESSIVEVAEQLGWLGAALRTSPCDYGIALCTPKVFVASNITSSAVDASSHVSAFPTHSTNIAAFKIGFSFRRLATDAKDSNGQCWQKLFVNPILVEGYPIARRLESVKGLEISLGVMANLLQVPRVTWFGVTPILKGFSAVAIPTKLIGGTMLWHLIFNEDTNQRISYDDSRIRSILGPNAEPVDVSNLERTRHILGWCAQVKSLTGSASLKHTITHNKCDNPRIDASCSALVAKIRVLMFIYRCTQCFLLNHALSPPKDSINLRSGKGFHFRREVHICGYHRCHRKEG